MMGLILAEPGFEQCDGVDEGVAQGDEQVDVVGVFAAGEAMGEVGAGVDGGTQFAAAGQAKRKWPSMTFEIGPSRPSVATAKGMGRSLRRRRRRPGSIMGDA